jgi:RimJ/RimL family protein N-acetyltransferase
MAQDGGENQSGTPATVVGGLLLGADRFVADWVAEKLNDMPWATSFSALGMLDQDRKRLIAGVIYHGYTGTDIILSIAATSPKWCRKSNLAMIFNYPFNTLGCRRATVIVDEHNHRSLRMVRGFGFQQEGLLREAAPDGSNRILFGMLKQECKFLK